MTTTVDTQSVGLDSGETDSITLTWDTDTDDNGVFEATAATEAGEPDSDSELVSVGSRDLDGFVRASTTAAAAVSRLTESKRSVAVGVSAVGRVARSAAAVRGIVASTTVSASSVWRSARSWQLPLGDSTKSKVLITAKEIETDHDNISLTADIKDAKVAALERYQRAGDVDREATAYGAFRRIPRDGSDPIEVRPPDALEPPFAPRLVVPEGFEANETPDGWFESTIDLGLEEPRGREPLERDVDPRLVDSQQVALDAGESSTIPLEWTPEGSDLGDWLATVESMDSSDETFVTVTDAPWVLSFPVANLQMVPEDVRPISVGSDDGVPSVQLGLALDATQAAVILGVGSRVEAAETRSIPDASNAVVDTLPDQELTCSVSTPDESDVEAGEYVLSDWSLTRSQPTAKPYDVELTLLRRD